MTSPISPEYAYYYEGYVAALDGKPRTLPEPYAQQPIIELFLGDVGFGANREEMWFDGWDAAELDIKQNNVEPDVHRLLRDLQTQLHEKPA